jgi:hypothetical protein
MHEKTQVAELVKNRCIEAALHAYEEAGISGLCAEGRWELAVQAMRCLDLSDEIRTIERPEKPTD